MEQNISFLFVFNNEQSDLIKEQIANYNNQYKKEFSSEVRPFYSNISINLNHEEINDYSLESKEDIAAIAITKPDNNIIGSVNIVFRAIGTEMGLGTYVYFQRIYLKKDFRSFQNFHQLNEVFLKNFRGQKSNLVDPRARYLIADLANPGLKSPRIRKYLLRKNYQFYNKTEVNTEMWFRKIEIDENINFKF